MILSGYAYHQYTAEKWVHRPSFELCKEKELTTHEKELVSLGIFTHQMMARFEVERKGLCMRMVRPYKQALGSNCSYQNLLKAAKEEDGVWMEGYRAMKVLFQMLVTMATERHNTWRHYTQSMTQHSHDFIKKYTDSLLDFLAIHGKRRQKCTDRILKAIEKPSHSHVTRGSLSAQRRRELEIRLYEDHLLGPLLRSMMNHSEWT